jgi:hypothetical protein
LVFLDQLLDTTDLFTTKPLIILEANWGEPEFGFILIAFNMYVGWFIAVSGIAEKPIWSNR